MSERTGAAAETTSSTPDTPLPSRGRTIRGWYTKSELGRLAIDGSLLDRVTGDYVVAGGWRSPACEVMRCWRPEILRMVPSEMSRWCPKHGETKLTWPDRFEMDRDGDEWRRAEERAWQHIAPRAGVPYRYQHVSFASCEETPPIAAARVLVEGDDYVGCGLMFQGGVGCGKTTAGRCIQRQFLIGNAVADGPDKIVWFDFPELSRLLLDPERRRETLAACLEADELFIDDVAASHTKPGGFVASLFEEIIIHREAHAWPLVMMTNLPPRAFRKMFGQRVHDRLRGDWGRWLNVDGPSMRRKRGDA